MDVSNQNEIKIGILFSLTGTTGITERGQYQASLLAIRQINEQGGINGKHLIPFVEDIASDPYLASKKAEKLILTDKVIAIIGLYTSACRKMVIPVLEKHDALLLYPTHYEGEEQHRNIFYCCPVPNQQLLYFIPWIIEALGRSFYLIGSDYIYCREINRHIRFLIQSHGGTVIGENYIALGNQKFHKNLKDIHQLNPDVIFSTLIGESAIAFYQQLHQYGLKQPVASTITAETEVAAIHTPYAIGHYSSFPYFNSIPSDINQAFLSEYRRTYGTDIISSAMENAYNSVFLLAEALRRMSSFDSDSLRRALPGLTFDAPQGKIMIDPDNQHLWVNPRIGQVNDKGQFTILWESDQLVSPIPFFEQITTSAPKEVSGALTPDMVEARIAKNEPLLHELKKSTDFLPYTLAFFDADGFLLEVLKWQTMNSPTAIHVFNAGTISWKSGPLSKSGIGLALSGHTTSCTMTTDHAAAELQEWISIGIPVKGGTSPSLYGVLGVFVKRIEPETLDLLLGSLSQMVNYCVQTVEQQKERLFFYPLLQHISDHMSKSLFVVKGEAMIFKNRLAEELLKTKPDFVHSILKEFTSHDQQQQRQVLRKKDDGELFELLIIRTLTYHYIYFKQLSHKSDLHPLKNKKPNPDEGSGRLQRNLSSNGLPCQNGLQNQCQRHDFG